MASVLLVEDNFMNRLLVRDALSLHNITVAEVETGREAVDWVRKNPPPDLILMDLSLPEMDGVTAMKHIKEESKDIPIIAVTASTTKGDIDKIITEGFEGCMCKPIDIKELVRIVKDYIDT